ncbi:hypothetical protein BKA65DRAFT_471699 [Rhexocercosporidium sp. MPI-PUGE-AT-0058]|nr:hypothetical protein BKA65DRAFT_471699 [Rhexocercosporidium sp. MPI-PUGE-AT-0058]
MESWRGRRIDETTDTTECLDSLNYDTMFSRREQVTHAESGTNEWIWSYGPYVEWCNDTSGILWIQGKPDSGKSVLAKTILGRLVSGSKDDLWHVADWFYNERGGDRSTSHSSMLRALLFQILKQDRRLFRYYKDFYRSPEWLASLPEVLLSLAAIKEDPPSILIKVLVLSRPNRQIEKGLKYSHRIVSEYANSRDIEMIADAGLRVLRKSMTSFDSSDEEDIRPPVNRRPCRPGTKHTPRRTKMNIFISGSMSRAGRMFLRARESEEEELSSIRTYIPKHAQGVILWVTLIMQDLIHRVQKGMFTFVELKELLLGLPLEIHGMYQRILFNLQKTNSYYDQVKARRILLWVIGASATRLLTLEELLDAFSITWDVETGLASMKDPVSSNRPQVRSWKHFQRSLQELCGPFLSVVRPSSQLSDQIFHDFDVDESFLVQLTHQTAKDFLASKDAESLTITDYEAKLKVDEDKMSYLKVVLPKDCTTYVPTMCCHQTPTNHDVQEMNFPTAKYSAQNSLVGKCFLLAIRSGMVVSIENMLFIASTQRWWSGFYKHHVKNAALLVAVEYGFIPETKILLAGHPDRLFSQHNKPLLARAFQLRDKCPEILDYMTHKTPGLHSRILESLLEKENERAGEKGVEGFVQREKQDESLDSIMQRLQIENDTCDEGVDVDEVRRAIGVIIAYQ